MPTHEAATAVTKAALKKADLAGRRDLEEALTEAQIAYVRSQIARRSKAIAEAKAVLAEANLSRNPADENLIKVHQDAMAEVRQFDEEVANHYAQYNEWLRKYKVGAGEHRKEATSAWEGIFEGFQRKKINLDDAQIKEARALLKAEGIEDEKVVTAFARMKAEYEALQDLYAQGIKGDDALAAKEAYRKAQIGYAKAIKGQTTEGKVKALWEELKPQIEAKAQKEFLEQSAIQWTKEIEVLEKVGITNNLALAKALAERTNSYRVWKNLEKDGEDAAAQAAAAKAAWEQNPSNPDLEKTYHELAAAAKEKVGLAGNAELNYKTSAGRYNEVAGDDKPAADEAWNGVLHVLKRDSSGIAADQLQNARQTLEEYDVTPHDDLLEAFVRMKQSYERDLSEKGQNLQFHNQYINTWRYFKSRCDNYKIDESKAEQLIREAREQVRDEVGNKNEVGGIVAGGAAVALVGGMGENEAAASPSVATTYTPKDRAADVLEAFDLKQPDIVDALARRKEAWDRLEEARRNHRAWLDSKQNVTQEVGTPNEEYGVTQRRLSDAEVAYQVTQYNFRKVCQNHGFNDVDANMIWDRMLGKYYSQEEWDLALKARDRAQDKWQMALTEAQQATAVYETLSQTSDKAAAELAQNNAAKAWSDALTAWKSYTVFDERYRRIAKTMGEDELLAPEMMLTGVENKTSNVPIRSSQKAARDSSANLRKAQERFENLPTRAQELLASKKSNQARLIDAQQELAAAQEEAASIGQARKMVDTPFGMDPEAIAQFEAASNQRLKAAENELAAAQQEQAQIADEEKMEVAFEGESLEVLADRERARQRVQKENVVVAKTAADQAEHAYVQEQVRLRREDPETGLGGWAKETIAEQGKREAGRLARLEKAKRGEQEQISGEEAELDLGYDPETGVYKNSSDVFGAGVVERIKYWVPPPPGSENLSEAELKQMLDEVHLADPRFLIFIAENYEKFPTPVKLTVDQFFTKEVREIALAAYNVREANRVRDEEQVDRGLFNDLHAGPVIPYQQPVQQTAPPTEQNPVVAEAPKELGKKNSNKVWQSLEKPSTPTAQNFTPNVSESPLLEEEICESGGEFDQAMTVEEQVATPTQRPPVPAC